MDLTDKQWAVLENYLGMVHLACAQILLPAFMRCPLGLKQRAEYLGPASFEVAVSLESALQQILDSLLRFRPSQRGLKRSDGGEQPVGGRQRSEERRVGKEFRRRIAGYHRKTNEEAICKR